MHACEVRVDTGLDWIGLATHHLNSLHHKPAAARYFCRNEDGAERALAEEAAELPDVAAGLGANTRAWRGRWQLPGSSGGCHGSNGRHGA